MGVRGLSSYLEQNPGNFSPFKLHNTQVVVDAQNFLHYVHTTSGIHAQFGGEYLALEVHVAKIISVFKQCEVRPIFVFDGCHDKSKLITQINRCRNRLQTCRNLLKLAQIHTDASHGSLNVPLLPPLATIALAQILRRLNVPLVVSERESDGDAASLAVYLNCPVISNDSDFYITVPAGGVSAHMLLLSRISFEALVNKDMCASCLERRNRAVCAYISCVKFLPDGPGFGRLPHAQKALFATLIGNDYIPSNLFSSVLPLSQGLRVPLTRKATRQMRASRRRSIYRHLIDWLSGFGQNVLDPVNRLVDRLPSGDRARCKALLLASLKSYEVCPTSTAAALLPFLSVSGDIPSACILDSKSYLSDLYLNGDPSRPKQLPTGENSFEDDRPTDTLLTRQHSIDHSFPVVPGSSGSSIMHHWPLSLVLSFRRLDLLPTLFDAVYSEGAVLNCAVEDLTQGASIYCCATPVRQLIYGLLLGLECSDASEDSVLHSDESISSSSAVKPTSVIEYSRKGSWQIKPARIPVQPLSLFAFNSATDDRRFAFIHHHLTTGYHPSSKVQAVLHGLALIMAVWHAHGSDSSTDWSSCALVLTFGAIAIASWIGADHKRVQSMRRQKQQLNACSDYFESQNGKTGSRLRPHIVHAFGQLQSTYASVLTLGSLLDSLASDGEKTHANKCIDLLPVSLIFPSGRLFHSLYSLLISQVPSGRMDYLQSTVFPRLLSSDNSGKVAEAVALLLRLLASLDSLHKGCQSADVTIEWTLPDHPKLPSQLPKVKTATKPHKTRTRKKTVIRSMAQIEAEVERIMLENGLSE
ncbi:hypothetical protein EG68_06710 [Paragonimus skrjabini miyazakii]|uniref:XPG N-terminal domain-containing protein n=1 Tax=Paragonimus skrjabini miyazakii TaxID=59628 RepID=A0A8S9YS75_9TREM|nr:hypothetical protein EG68_06710 [Paragonimus skrjabini miyazakii]